MELVVMAAGMGTAVGGAATLVGSTAQQTANNILMTTAGYEEGLSLFSMSAVGFILIGVTILYFSTIGYSLMQRVFRKYNEEEALKVQNVTETVEEDFSDIPQWKATLSLAVLLLCIVGFVLTSFQPFKQYLDIGVVALLGATALMCTGCIPVKEAMSEGVDWNTVIILGACTGFAKGLDVSGGGRVIADFVLNLFGGPEASAVVLMIVCACVTTVLTNFMTNTSLAAMMTPIVIQMALQMGISPVPYVIVIGCIATNIATATPVGTTAVTMTLPTGYKYMDYVKIGLPLNVILLATACILCPIFYL